MISRGALIRGAIALCVAVSCGGGGAPSVPGMCSADVPVGQACNMLGDAAPAITPTCTTATLPSGEGGTVVDGTYFLTAQTYYNVAVCAKVPISETILLAGGCLQIAVGAPLAVTAAARLTIAGNGLTLTRTCAQLAVDAGTTMADTPLQTFTATTTTFALFTKTASSEYSAVFTRR